MEFPPERQQYAYITLAGFQSESSSATISDTQVHGTLSQPLSRCHSTYTRVFTVLYISNCIFPPEKQQDFASIGGLLSILHNVFGFEF